VALQEEWVKMDEVFIEKLYDSMLRQITALIEAKGRSTHY
jgi:hypothetical protein